MSAAGRPDPVAIRSVASCLATVAAALDEGATAIRLVRSGAWRGPAADAAIARLSAYDHPQEAAALVLREVAGALVVHAGVLDEALLLLGKADALRTQWERAHVRDLDIGGVLHRPFGSPGPEPAAGPGDAVAAAMRSAADAMVTDSARRTAAIVLQAAGQAPTLVPFQVRHLGADAVGRSLAGSGIPGAVQAGAVVRYVAEAPGTTLARNAAYVDAHGGRAVGLGLDAAGALPVVGMPADVAHLALDLAKGDAEGAVFDAVGLVPFVGDAVAGSRVGTRVLARSEHAAARLDELAAASSRVDLAHDVYDKSRAAVEAVPGADSTPSVEGLAGGGGVYEEVAARAAGLPGAGSTTLPSRSLVVGLAGSTATRWRAVDVVRHGPRVGGPAAWAGRADVTEGGRVVTYEFTMTPGGALDGRPRAVASRPVPVARRALPGSGEEPRPVRGPGR